MPLDANFAALDAAVSDLFATDTVQYKPKGSDDPAVPVKFAPIDPLRQEGIAPGQVTLRWAPLSNFGVITPVVGDSFIDQTGSTYLVNQVQMDANQSVRLVVTKKGS